MNLSRKWMDSSNREYFRNILLKQ